VNVVAMTLGKYRRRPAAARTCRITIPVREDPGAFTDVATPLGLGREVGPAVR
jgi:hypothetical protein